MKGGAGKCRLGTLCLTCLDPLRMDRGDISDHMGDRLPFVDLGTDFHAVQITSGHRHTCALSSLGKLKCWGRGPAVGLNFSTRSSAGVGNSPNEMGDQLPFLDLGLEVLQISAGNYHTCADACMHHPSTIPPHLEVSGSPRLKKASLFELATGSYRCWWMTP